MTDETKGLVSNPVAEAKPSSMTQKQLGEAMSQLDLSSVPEEKRTAAVMDHFFKVMADNVHDRDLANQIKSSRILRNGLAVR